MNPILPGGTIGILGGGQLGRMLALEARRMGYHVIVFDPSPDAPCRQVADEHIVANYDDLAAITRFGDKCDVITYEFENIAEQAAGEGVCSQCRRACNRFSTHRDTRRYRSGKRADRLSRDYQDRL